MTEIGNEEKTEMQEFKGFGCELTKKNPNKQTNKQKLKPF